ncbi:MAG: multidrug transporter [Clostridiales bacterium]|nr:multidrug transporter [Clostridiales bacterium]
MNPVVLYLMLIGGCVLGAFASYFFKGATLRLEKFSIALLVREKFIWIGGLLYIIAAVNNIFLLGYLDYSILLPMSSITYIWTLIIAYKLLGEKITARKVIGVAAIILGAALLASS